MDTQLKELIKIWPNISKLFTPQNDKEYNQTVSVLDELLDIVRNNEEHPLASLLEVIGTVVDAYEFVDDYENEFLRNES